MNPVLDVRDLVVEAGGVRIVDGVSFAVDAGEVLCLIGESGSGKSLTVAAVLGLLPRGVRVTGGEVLVEGRNVRALPPKELRRLRGGAVGAVFQDPMTSLNPVHRVGRQVAEAVRLHRPPRGGALREEADGLLARVGVVDAGQRYPHELSGGMRQRAVIAMAAANGPRLLVADEPTTALDVSVQARVLADLRRTREATGSALLLVTHDLGVVAQNADRVAVMYAGRVVETGPVEQIFAAPRHPYTVGLLASSLDMETELGDLPMIPGQPPAPAARPSGCAFHPRCPRAEARCATEDPPLVDDVACWFAS